MTQVETAPSNTLAPRRERIPVAVLGATGAVGQRFVQMLEAHPWFRLHEVVASERSAGKTYREAADWRLGTQMPRDAESMSVKELGAELESRLLFSGLDSSVAGEAEDLYANRGGIVVHAIAQRAIVADVDFDSLLPYKLGAVIRQQEVFGRLADWIPCL